MIETNGEGLAFPFDNIPAANVGEAWVAPDHRGIGIARTLLRAAEKDRDTQAVWVEHGTGNPLARGFWNKHFDTFEYLMMREISL